MTVDGLNNDILYFPFILLVTNLMFTFAHNLHIHKNSIPLEMVYDLQWVLWSPSAFKMIRCVANGWKFNNIIGMCNVMLKNISPLSFAISQSQFQSRNLGSVFLFGWTKKNPMPYSTNTRNKRLQHAGLRFKSQSIFLRCAHFSAWNRPIFHIDWCRFIFILRLKCANLLAHSFIRD